MGGILREDTQWANMILVQGDLIVPFGVSLTIEAAAPQTIVHFLTGGMLIVEGKLNLNGALFTGTDALSRGLMCV